MPHTLPALPYDFAALEPHIDTQTMQIHHGKHHQTYVTNLNTALDKHPDLHNKTLDDLIRGVSSVPGQSVDGRKEGDSGRRRLGARVLLEVPESPRRLSRGVVERRQLE
jgi:hypothetical protein